MWCHLMASLDLIPSIELNFTMFSLSDSATSNKEQWQCYAEQIIVANFEILLFAGF